jgi:PAS domain S-box-containing protein
MSARRRKGSAPAPGEIQAFLSVAVLGQTLARAVDGAFALAPDGQVVMWNWMAEKILGWTAKDMVGRRADEALAGGREQWRNWCGIDDAVERFEMEAQTKSGQSIWLDVGVVELPTSDAGVLRVYVFRDGSTTKGLVDAIQSLRAPASAAGPRSSLTKREIEVLRLMSTGANTKALATRLHLSPATVRNHVQNILEKLGVHSRLEAVAWMTRASRSRQDEA